MSLTFYTRTSSEWVLDQERPYILKIRDLPPEEKPRERLITHGPEALSSTELLAVLLTTGTKKEDVMEMSERILKEYGDRGIFNQRNVAKLVNDLHIPVTKAAQIVACSELGRRFFARNSNAAPVIRTAKEVFEHTQDMAQFPKEHLRGIYLNSRYKIIHEEVISIGTVDANMVHPREVFKPALEYSAAAVILVHNHPSGEPEPSPADLTITQQLVEAGKLLGIDLIDHVIITRGGYATVPFIR